MTQTSRTTSKLPESTLVLPTKPVLEPKSFRTLVLKTKGKVVNWPRSSTRAVTARAVHVKQLCELYNDVNCELYNDVNDWLFRLLCFCCFNLRAFGSLSFHLCLLYASLFTLVTLSQSRIDSLSYYLFLFAFLVVVRRFLLCVRGVHQLDLLNVGRVKVSKKEDTRNFG